MSKREISTPQQLDVALSASGLRKHVQLWKVAEGRSFRWAEALGLIAAVLLVAIGVVRGLSESAGAGAAVPLALGVLMIASFIFSHMQRQINALAELVKRLERDQSPPSRSA